VNNLSKNSLFLEILNKAQRLMLFCSIVTLPFLHLPFNIPLVGGNLPYFFIYAGFLFFVIKQYLYPQIYTEFEKKVFLFLIGIFLWNLISTVVGVWNYQYYNIVDLLQMDKFKNAYEVLSLSQYNISELTAIKFWLSIRAVRTSFFDILNTYGITAWICVLYFGHEKELLSDIRNGVIVLVICMSLYSLFEIGYLLGNRSCEKLLSTINSIYIKTADTHGWWPPLLWKGQLRSLFLEPSFLGIHAAFFFPILIDKILHKVSCKNFILLNALILLILLTKARTATLLFIGEIGLSCLVIPFVLGREGVRKLFLIILSTITMFCISLALISNFTSKTFSNNEVMEVSDYIEENVMSISGNKRSNSARYGNVRATFRTGIQHPLFGVGKGMQAAYIRNNFTKDEQTVGEIRLWIKTMEKKGPFKAGFPMLNGFADQIAQTGLIGLALFLTPIIWILVKIIKNPFLLFNSDFVCLFIAYIGIIMAMFSNVAFIPYYLLTSILLNLLHVKKGDKCNAIN